VSRAVPAPCDPAEIERFLATYLYREEAFFVDEILRLDAEKHEIEARVDTTQPLPLSSLQRNDARHPAHVSAGEQIQITGSLGFLHAWFFHGCRWDEGWAGFGNRIHRADFKNLARIGPPLEVASRELRARAGSRRVLLRMEFTFRQEGRLVYVGDQTAMFMKDREF
jgi:hypothetical protein